jgi:hypothetical protein
MISWFQTIDNMWQATQTPFLAWLVHPSWPHLLYSFVAPCVTQTLPLMTPLLHPLKLHCLNVTFAPCVIILPRWWSTDYYSSRKHVDQQTYATLWQRQQSIYFSSPSRPQPRASKEWVHCACRWCRLLCTALNRMI